MRLFLAFVLPLAILSPALAFDLRPSPAEQIKIGKEASAQIRKEEKVLPDSDPRVKYIREVGKALVLKHIPESERKRRPFEYTFDIIDSKEINAFALPGGPIFFYTGIIDTFTTMDQFNGVLGHEITHVRNQHWASQYADNMKRRLGLAVILAMINANESLASAADIVDQGLFLLPYSRKHETESDKFGYNMVKADGLNPKGMADVFRMLSKGNGVGYTEILATHPDPAKRAQAIEDRMKKESFVAPSQKPLPFETQAMKVAKNPPPKPPTAPKPLALGHVCWSCGTHDVEQMSRFDTFVAELRARNLGY